MPRPSAATLPPLVKTKVAAMCDCDPRTVDAYLRGTTQAPAMVDRIEGALRHYGYAVLVRARGEAVQP